LKFKQPKFYPFIDSKKNLKFDKEDKTLKIPKFLEKTGIHGERNEKFLKQLEEKEKMNSLTKTMRKTYRHKKNFENRNIQNPKTLSLKRNKSSFDLQNLSKIWEQ
jgi:hypothetical protein